MNSAILAFIRERGLFLDKDIFELLSGFESFESARVFLEYLEQVSGEKFISKATLRNNLQEVRRVSSQFSLDDRAVFESVSVKLGFEVEVVRTSIPSPETTSGHYYRIFYADTKPDRALSVQDFTDHFRSRYQQLQHFLVARPELSYGLVSINKLSGQRSRVSVIGIVSEKRVTKNKNIILRVEDLTGSITCLARREIGEVFAKVEELQLDDVVGIKASGNRDLLFVHDVVFPDAFLSAKTRFEEDICIAFLSDIHCGSELHLEKSFRAFLQWIQSEDEAAQKIRYIFLVGDCVDGVGIFPGQEQGLRLKSMHEQYALLASYLREIPSRIGLFLCPGQHDASRVAEPQPLISRRYAPMLYEIENLVLVTNPCMVHLFENEKVFKVLMYHGASIHGFIDRIPELRSIKAHRFPAKAVCHMLKRRHLAPVHSECVYIPSHGSDPLVISEVPDVLVTGEVHRLDVENYNGVLVITGSCWQAQTPFEEKVGNVPDPCKVPVLNLKTHQLQVFDFGVPEELGYALG